MIKSLKKICLIPAREGSSRLNGKMLRLLAGKTIISHTYHNVKNSKVFDDVFVVTDSLLITKTLEKELAQVIFDDHPYKCGSDRIASAAKKIDADIVVNVQGDEPFLQKELLSNVVTALEREISNPDGVNVVSAMVQSSNFLDYKNPNCVKVVVDKNNYALYFSRSPIPYYTEASADFNFRYHVGIYAFQRKTLLKYYQNNRSDYEKNESLEMLRLLESGGEKIKMVLSKTDVIGINTSEDLKKAEELLLINQPS